MKAALGPLVESGRYSLELHKHRFTLAMVPEDEAFFFALREPIERFVSGFNSRQRQGRPRHFRPWSEKEKAVFEHFGSANALALALSSEDEGERARAEEAMRTIKHLRSVFRWIGDEESFAAREPRLLKVLFTDRLDEDFADLVERLGLGSAPPVLPHDPVRAHRAPEAHQALEEQATLNLRRWYSRDYAFWELCRKLEAERRPGARPPPPDRVPPGRADGLAGPGGA